MSTDLKQRPMQPVYIKRNFGGSSLNISPTGSSLHIGESFHKSGKLSGHFTMIKGEFSEAGDSQLNISNVNLSKSTSNLKQALAAQSYAGGFGYLGVAAISRTRPPSPKSDSLLKFKEKYIKAMDTSDILHNIGMEEPSSAPLPTRPKETNNDVEEEAVIPPNADTIEPKELDPLGMTRVVVKAHTYSFCQLSLGQNRLALDLSNISLTSSILGGAERHYPPRLVNILQHEGSPSESSLPRHKLPPQAIG